MKRKWLSTEQENVKPTNVNVIWMEEVAVEEDFEDNDYTRPHWERATCETPVQIKDMKEPVVALIDHGSEINLMSMDYHKRGKWLINIKHGWNIVGLESQIDNKRRPLYIEIIEQDKKKHKIDSTQEFNVETLNREKPLE